MARNIFILGLILCVVSVLSGIIWVASSSRGGPIHFNPGWMLIAVGALVLGVHIKAWQEAQAIEITLQRKEEQLEDLLLQTRNQKSAVDAFADGLDVAIFVCDPRATVQYANRHAMELFGFDRPEGRSILAVTLSVDLEQLVLQAAKLPDDLHKELSFTYPKDRIAIAKVWTTQPNRTRVYLSLVEITDLRRLERVRRDFVANVSHELRTPMTIIRAYAETMLDDDDSEIRARYLPRIISEVDRLSTITQDLLVLSTSESSPVRKAPCDFADLMRATVQQLQTQAQEKKLLMAYHGPDSLFIEANSSQMTQVALNLIENAIKYTNEGGVDVTLKEQPGSVLLTVVDTGIGISSEHSQRVFERFYRVDKGRSRASGGTGLGLSIVKHIIEAHGGKVALKSALNQGSTFTVELPIGNP